MIYLGRFRHSALNRLLLPGNPILRCENQPSENIFNNNHPLKITY